MGGGGGRSAAIRRAEVDDGEALLLLVPVPVGQVLSEVARRERFLLDVLVLFLVALWLMMAALRDDGDAFLASNGIFQSTAMAGVCVPS